MNETLNPQTIQYMFWQLHLEQYLNIVSEMTNDPAPKEAFAKILPYTALKNFMYDFVGWHLDESPPQPNPNITLGELVAAAGKMAMLGAYKDEGINDNETLVMIEQTGKMILQELIVKPLTTIGWQEMGVAPLSDDMPF